MKISRDRKLDVAYVELRRGKVAKTLELKRGLLIDLDKDGEILGIEVLSVRKLAPILRATFSKSKVTSKKAA